jgi:predicted dehydrogenase
MGATAKVTRRRFINATATGAAAMPAVIRGRIPDDVVNLGIIGVGIRGKQLLAALGYVHPVTPTYLRSPNSRVNTKPGTPDGKPDPNVRFVGVCDVFDGNTEFGRAAADQGPSKGGIKTYRDYRDMLTDPSVDGVIIATPDHWHATITMDAVKAGKDVYCEKCWTHTADEAVAAYDLIKQQGTVFQLGHQTRQDANHIRAKELIAEGMLGDIHLVETYTNRNDGNGAWQYVIPEGAEDTKNLDWDMWLGKAPKIAYEPKRCWQWRRFWDYGTGMSGDLLSHSLDAVNMVMGMGIPHSAVASGGVYVWRDGREVPDVFQAAYDYPDLHMTVMYNGNLGSAFDRGKKFFGRDAALDLTDGVSVVADKRSTRYAEKVKEAEELQRQQAKATQAQAELKAVTSATEQWTINKGMLYSFTPEGKQVNTVWAHLRDWVDCMKTRKQPRCNVDQAFEEAMIAHMATTAYKTGRRVFWDPKQRKII